MVDQSHSNDKRRTAKPLASELAPVIVHDLRVGRRDFWQEGVGAGEFDLDPGEPPLVRE